MGPLVVVLSLPLLELAGQVVGVSEGCPSVELVLVRAVAPLHLPWWAVGYSNCAALTMLASAGRIEVARV